MMLDKGFFYLITNRSTLFNSAMPFAHRNIFANVLWDKRKFIT